MHGPDQPSAKRSLSRGERLIRLLGSVVDPRAWLHLLKIVNYYNYSHVRPLRELAIGIEPNISPDAVFSNPHHISIGDRVRLGSRCHLWAGRGSGRIVIGDDVLFGPEVMLTAASYRFNDGSPVTLQNMDEADIVIGDDVWLATRAVILPGVTIGNGAIVSANSVVREEVPAGAIVAGCPAKVVGQRS